MIVLLAPMLADTDRAMDLTTLYNVLCEDQIRNEDEDPIVSLMRSSVHISLQSLEHSDPECIELLYLLALLPGGILPKDLDQLWNAAKQKVGKHGSRSMRDSFLTAFEDEAYEFAADCKWKRPFLKLRKNRLIQETKIVFNGKHETNPNWFDSTLLSLPVFVLSFAEAQITPVLYEAFQAVLADYFRRELSKLYERN